MSGHCAAASVKRGTSIGRSPFHFRQPGFTLPELIAVLVILAVIAAVGAPKLVTSGFGDSRFVNEASSALRYAQSAALAMQRTVCVTTNATSVTLTYNATYGSTSCGAAALTPPGGGAGPYQVTAPTGSSFTAGTGTFTFDRAGRPSAAQALTVSGGSQIIVEAETGYVHN